MLFWKLLLLEKGYQDFTLKISICSKSSSRKTNIFIRFFLMNKKKDSFSILWHFQLVYLLWKCYFLLKFNLCILKLFLKSFIKLKSWCQLESHCYRSCLNFEKYQMHELPNYLEQNSEIFIWNYWQCCEVQNCSLNSRNRGKIVIAAVFWNR